MQIKNKGSKKNGFTLFEMLVVISIIGILVATIAASFSSAQIRARDARRTQDLNSLQKAAEQYYAEWGVYVNNDMYDPGDRWNNRAGTMMFMVPSDPRSGTYNYNASNSSTYCVCADLEQDRGGNSSNSACNFSTLSTAGYYCVANQQ